MGHNARSHCGPIQAKVRKAKYSKQFAITERNRQKKRLRHLRDHPNDKQTTKLLK